MHQERVVLLIDIWHPYLTTSLIHELSTCFHNFTRRKKLTNDDDDTNVNDIKYNQHDYHYTMKAIVIGNHGVGKSKFIMRACNDKYVDSYMMSLLQFESSLLTIQNKVVKMYLWDYSSPERYHAMSSSYYRLANVIFVLFDKSESIHTCSFWINEIKKYAPEESIIIIVRSKMDLVSSSLPSSTTTEAAISQIELDEFFSIHGKLPYHEVSSKTGYGIKSVLHSAVKLFLQKKNLIPGPEQNMKGISLIDKKSNAYCLIL
jgi:GTPase SAR1 family protein